MKEKDELVRIRKLLFRKHKAVITKLKTANARFTRFGLEDDRLEQLKREGEKEGLCYALKTLDKICQTEMALG